MTENPDLVTKAHVAATVKEGAQRLAATMTTLEHLLTTDEQHEAAEAVRAEGKRQLDILNEL